MSSIKLSPNASGTGEFTIAAPNSNTNRTLTLPDQTGTVLTGSGPISVNASTPTNAVTLDASGNLGVGTTLPISKLDAVVNISGGSDILTIQNQNTGSNTTKYAGLKFKGNDTVGSSKDSAYIRAFPSDQDFVGSYLSFWTRNADSLGERMRIDSSGNFLVGTTNSFARLTVESSLNQDKLAIRGYGDNLGYGSTWYKATTNSTPLRFRNTANTADIGSISTTDTSTAYNTSSDYRLKRDIAPMTGALEKVAALKPVTYKWRADGSDGEGFIAHELAEVVPQCVTGEKDAVDAEGNPVYQGIDTSFLVATLTAAIQEQQALIDAQQTALQTLTARIEALEAK